MALWPIELMAKALDFHAKDLLAKVQHYQALSLRMFGHLMINLDEIKQINMFVSV